MTRSVLGLVFAALLAGFTSGCSSYIELDPVAEPEVRPPPPLLTFVFPLHEQQLSGADDVDAASPGLQVDVTVRVRDLENDLALNDIQLQLGGEEPRWVPISESPQGRVAVLAALTVSEAINLTAHAAQLTATVAIEEEEQPRAIETVSALITPIVDDGCEQNLHLPGDLTVGADTVLPGAADCLTLGGDLIITSTDRVDLDGLEALVEVHGSVIVENNPSLTDLDDLTSLHRIGGDLLVIENPALSPSVVAALIDRVGRDNIGGEVVLDGESM